MASVRRLGENDTGLVAIARKGPGSIIFVTIGTDKQEMEGEAGRARGSGRLVLRLLAIPGEL
jgi:hypothetical protein